VGEGIALSGVFITYQCVRLDYCLEAAIRSCMDFCDDVYINDGRSKDGTLDILYRLQVEYGKDRVRIIEKDWNHDRAFWADERNYLLDIIPKKNFVLNLGADECIHEDDYNKILAMLPRLENKSALQYLVKHFYGLPSYTISGPNWSRVLTKTWRNDTGIRYYNRPKGCADDPLWPNKTPVHFVRCLSSGATVYHYGHCRHPKAVGTKNVKADALYKNSAEFKDGSLPKIKSYDYKLDLFIKNGGVQPFSGFHSKHMERWVAAHANQSTLWRV